MHTMNGDDLLRHIDTGDRLGDVVASSDVYDREFGSEMASWELRFHREFQERISSRLYRLRGFVHHTRDRNIILLSPSPWMHSGQMIYFASDQEQPPDGARVEITGRNISVPRLLERSNESVRAFTVESVEPLPLELMSEIEPPLGLRELSRMLFEHVGMAEASKRVFARLFVSSPPFEGSIGGLTTGIQAIASKTQVKRLFTFMKKILPPTLRGRVGKYRNIRGVQVLTRKNWRVEIGQPGPSEMRSLCVDRKDPSGFSEVSMGAMTTASTSTLPDVPLALASEDFWIESTDARELRLPILKTAITAQLLVPSVSSRGVDSVTQHVLTRLEVLRESFGLDDSALARGSILDADAMGRPLSTLRLARSSARADWKEKVSTKELKRSWDRILEPALKEFIELTQFKIDSDKQYGESAPVHKFDTRVWRALKRLDTGTTGSLGPTLDEIAHEAGVESHIATETLTKMKQSGVIYEPRAGHFRLV